MKELNQGFYHAAAKALAKWWRPSSNSSRSEDIYACGTTTSATMQIQGRLKVFAGTGIRFKGSWSEGTRLHSPINSGRKLSGLNHRDKTISSWSSTGTGGYHSSKLNPILYIDRLGKVARAAHSVETFIFKNISFFVSIHYVWGLRQCHIFRSLCKDKQIRRMETSDYTR